MSSTPLPLYTPKPFILNELTALSDIVQLPKFWATLKHQPRGNRTVVVYPGFMTSDRVTLPLRWTLQQLGHRVHGWGLGKNTGDVWEIVPQLAQKLDEHDGPITLIGWSLGGYMAREVARMRPERVEHIITMASPVIGGPKYTIAAQYYRDVLGMDLDDIAREVDARREVPLKAPVLAIYSTKDRVVCPGACIDHHHQDTQHIATQCSHAGMGFSPEIYRLIANRLNHISNIG